MSIPQSLPSRIETAVAPIIGSRIVRFLGLLGLCAAYLQGGLNKLFDYPAAIGEMQHFGLEPAGLFAPMAIALELGASAMILTGIGRWLGALALAAFTLAATFIALAFWQLPPGHERFMAANSFFEHLGLSGGFLLVAWMDVKRRHRSATAA